MEISIGVLGFECSAATVHRVSHRLQGVHSLLFGRSPSGFARPAMRLFSVGVRTFTDMYIADTVNLTDLEVVAILSTGTSVGRCGGDVVKSREMWGMSSA